MALLWLSGACGPSDSLETTLGEGSETPTMPPEDAVAPEAPPRVNHPQGGAQSSAIARFGGGLLVADEDHQVVRWLAPAQIVAAKSATEAAEEGAVPQARLPMPGPPASVLALDDRIFVTVRDPGLVMELALDEGALREVRRASVAADAWGMTLTREGDALLVSSGWSHVVTRVSLDDLSSTWEVNVLKEPRAIVAAEGGDSAYVTHLSGASLTRIDGLHDTPAARGVELPTAPLRVPNDAFTQEREQAASLAYSAVLSPDGRRLFVPRHALGATGRFGWAGQPTVDVMLVHSDTSLAQRGDKLPLSRNPNQPLADRAWEIVGDGPLMRGRTFIQPRATVYRTTTNTLLVASEGLDELVELDALAIDPSAHVMRRHDLGAPQDEVPPCGAPSGVALSADEKTAYVFCRTTTTIATVPLDPIDAKQDAPRYLRIDGDPLTGLAGEGRRFFYDADDGRMSLFAACASCHPDGRDDGHVWLETGLDALRAFPQAQNHSAVLIRGEPRQTPILAGRVTHEGPFGWRGGSKSLEHRVLKGFGLHEWFGHEWIDAKARHRAEALAAFLRVGLRPPPVDEREPTALERRGKEVFEADTSFCARCHSGPMLSDFERHDVDLRAESALFIGEESAKLRTPSLLFVGGSAPYLHDGSAPTLAALIDNNHDRMGMTSLLTDDDKQALLAFLRAQGGSKYEFPELTIARGVEPPLPPGHDALLSPRPADDAWESAPPIELARASTKCSAQQLREWVRVKCKIHADEAQMIGGSPEGVQLRHGDPYLTKSPPPWIDYVKQDHLFVTFPVRPGDRRIIQGIDDFMTSFDGRVVISETWLAGDTAPAIVAVHTLD